MNTVSEPQESQIERRLAILEQKMAIVFCTEAPTTDWESSVGTFQDDPLFVEAMRLGREYRVSQRSLFDASEGS